jgi:hypothetical protein
VDHLPRRVVLRHALQVSAALVAAATFSRRSHAADSCVDPASETLRTSLHYANDASDPKLTCKLCAFFTADTSKSSCGNCMIMSGAVDQTGHCDSWSAKSG